VIKLAASETPILAAFVDTPDLPIHRDAEQADTIEVSALLQKDIWVE
jgi:hypothetical protein